MKSRNKKNIIMTGGGTGGHVYPALPIIRLLQQEGYAISWIGSRKGIERELVSTWGVSYKSISTGKLRRYFSFQNFTDLFRILAGFFQSFFYMLKNRPVLVFSKGGFVSVPPVMAAALLGIPVLTHDSDVDPGLATRINSHFARKIFVAYEKSKTYFSGKQEEKIIVSGNPVRREFFEDTSSLPEEWVRLIGDKKLIIVIGGSLGAQQLNQLVQESLTELTSRYFIVHQMGEKNFKPQEIENYLPLAYINEELPALFRRADLALSRAGAGTLWELSASGTAAVLLPLTVGSRGDQVKNAVIFKEAGIAEILSDKADKEELIMVTRSILDNPDILSNMKKAANRFSGKAAEEIILSWIHKEEKT